MEKWIWDAAIIYAVANEVAKAGKNGFNHTTNKAFTSTMASGQSKKLGLELDLGGKYLWNNDTTLEADIGYHFTGDYYSYTNDASVKNDTKNSFIIRAGIGIEF